MTRGWIALGSGSAFVSVALGAFGAHSLASSLSEKNLSIWHTAAQYQMYHALALLAVGLWASQHPDSHIGVAGWGFAAGTVLFCGSLYALALTDVKILGAVTPVGGLAFMVGWVSLMLVAWRG